MTYYASDFLGLYGENDYIEVPDDNLHPQRLGRIEHSLNSLSRFGREVRVHLCVRTIEPVIRQRLDPISLVAVRAHRYERLVINQEHAINPIDLDGGRFRLEPGLIHLGSSVQRSQDHRPDFDSCY